ncbi:MAG TPA: hypothetical protein VFO73_02125 [Candidatus Limnocylindrales bacterium]|nr:hypothetical protein [Candidatus Limnocylindrales bacterium]
MPDGPRHAVRRDAGPARHEVPLVDEAALAAALHADRLLAAARDLGIARWEAYLAVIPDQLRDGDLRDLRSAAMRARAAYGPKDSIRDALSAELTEPFLESIDRLLKVLARRELRGDP